MRRIVLCGFLALLLGPFALADEWSRESTVEFGEGQQLSVWQHGSTKMIFLADSLSYLYQRSLTGQSWTRFVDAKSKNPRGVVAVTGHDTLLISRYGLGLNEDSAGVYRCADPSFRFASFDWIPMAARNTRIHGMFASPATDTLLYAVCKQFESSSGGESGTQWSRDFGTEWYHIDCDMDDPPKDSEPWMEHEGFGSNDNERLWFVSRTGWLNPGVRKHQIGGEYQDCDGSTEEYFHTPIRGLAGFYQATPFYYSIGIFCAGVYSGDSIGIWISNDSGTTWSFCDSTAYPITSIVGRLWYQCSGYRIDYFAATDGYGVLRSLDGGTTWEFCNTGLRCQHIQRMVLGHDSSTVYALGRWSTYHSADKGATWTEIIDGLREVPVSSVAQYDPDHYLLADFDLLYKSSNAWETKKTWYAFEGLPSSDPVGHIRAEHLTTYPGNESHLLAVVYEPDSDTVSVGKTKIYRSTDGGDTWHLVYLNETAGVSAHCTSVTFDPSDDSTVYVTFGDSTANYVEVSTSYGDSASWSDADNGLSSIDGCLSLAVNSEDGDVLYVGTKGDGVYKSTNGGTSWSSSGLTNHFVRDMVVSLVDTDVVWAATDSGVYRSANSGSTWVLKDSLMTYKDAYSLAVEDIGGYDHAYVVCVDGVHGYIYTSTGEGVSWERIDSGLPFNWLVFDDDGVYVNLEATRPSIDKRLYVGTTDGVYVHDLGPYSGRVRADETWDFGPIEIRGDLTIDSAVTLTVADGVTFDIKDGDELSAGLSTTLTEFIVKGTLRIEGESSSPVVFDPESDWNGWYGIRSDSAGKIVIDHAEIAGADYGVKITNEAADSITNSSFKTCLL